MTPDTPLLGGREGAHRLLAEGLHRQRRQRPRARRRARLRRRLERRPGRRRHAALQRPRHVHAPRPCARRASSARWRASRRSRPASRPIAPASPSSPAIRRSASRATSSAWRVDLPAPFGQGRGDAAAAAHPHRAGRAATGGQADGADEPTRDACRSISAACCRRTSCARRAATPAGSCAARCASSTRGPASGDRAAVEPTPLDPIERCPARRRRAANVTLKQLDVDVWEGVLARFQGDAGRGARCRARRGEGPPPLVFDSGGGTGYVPTTIALRVGELVLGSRRLSQRHRRPVAAGRALARQRRCRRARRLPRIPAGAARRGAAAGPRLRAPLAPQPAEGRSRARREPARRAAGEHPGARHRRRRLRAARQAARPARGRGRSTARRRPRGAARMAALEAQPRRCPKRSSSPTGTWGGAAGAGAPAGARRAAMNFILTLADSGALLERLGMGRVVKGGKGSLDRRRRRGPARRSRPTTPKMTGQIKVAIDAGPVPQGRPGRGAPARRAQPAVAASAACCSTSAMSSPKASPSTTSSATSGSARDWRRPTTCACAASPRRC